MKGIRWSGLLVLIVCLFLPGCSGDGDSPTDPLPTNDAVLLQSITPSTATTLVAGSTVSFHVRVRYALATADTGSIPLVIEDQNFRVLTTPPQQSAAVVRGEGTVELADTVDLPATGVTQVHVFIPLFPAGSSRSTAVQQVTYSVRQP